MSLHLPLPSLPFTSVGTTDRPTSCCVQAELSIHIGLITVDDEKRPSERIEQRTSNIEEGPICPL
jgi:hypothetical protein